MGMPPTLQKEEFSRAFVAAVAAVAGYSVAWPTQDVDKIDLTLMARGSNGQVRSPKLDIQLKCTERDDGSGDELAFDIDLDTYDALRQTDYVVPRYLVVVVVPPGVAQWLQQTPEEMVLRRCAYWADLMGAGPVGGQTATRMRLPRHQLFTPESLQQLMAAVGRE